MTDLRSEPTSDTSHTTSTIDLTEPEPTDPADRTDRTDPADPADRCAAPRRAELLLGADAQPLDQPRTAFGFGRPAAPEPRGGLVHDDSEAHALVVAPTGAGKTTWMACQLARHPGSAVVFDPKGELAALTARRRADLGNEVVVLDPFGVTDAFDLPCERASFDPLSTLEGSACLEDDVMAMATEIQDAPGVRDPFWPETAIDLTAGLILQAATGGDGAPSWDHVISHVHHGEFDMKTATMLDQDEVANRTAYASFATYLGHPEQNTRPSVLSTARAGLRAFKTPAVRRAMASTSFDLEGMVSGAAPTTLYVVLPPQHIQSHARVVRLWLSALLRVLTAPGPAQARDQQADVLFLIDELPGLGRMAFVPSLYAYVRSFGVRVVSVVQSLGQLDAVYGIEARVIRENAGVRIAFGVTDRDQAEAVAPMLDTTAEQVLDTDRHDLLVRQHDRTLRCRRATHLDPAFVPAGWFDPNPYHRAAPAPAR